MGNSRLTIAMMRELAVAKPESPPAFFAVHVHENVERSTQIRAASGSGYCGSIAFF